MGRPSKPYGVCWCDCHTPTGEHGERLAGGWPLYDEPTAVLTACATCDRFHKHYLSTGLDWFYDDDTGLPKSAA